MVDPAGKSFRQTALESGLVSQQQVDDALATLAGEAPPELVNLDDITDDALAERLIELEYLNRWQVEQLKEGHTRFQLGPYRILDAIGKGGMGHVFKGEHELLGRIEAVKVLPRSKTTEEAIASFRREIRVQAQLDHPNLVRVSYADQQGDTHFFVTEYVPGTDLRKLVRKHGPLDAAVAASIIAQAADGLGYAHRKGLVHRDIKPGNLLVTPEGRTKLTDLGLAWYLMDDIGPVAGGPAGTIVGTTDFLAPELIRDPDKILPVSDIYSLGCTLYYAVTGKVPFPGGSSADKIRRHLQETPFNPLHFNPDLPTEICRIIAQLMDKNPETRVPTAARVAELLAPWRSDHLPSDLLQFSERTLATSEASGRPPLASGSALAETVTFDASDVLPELREKADPPSQLSQGTLPIDAASEETSPEVHGRQRAADIADQSVGKSLMRGKYLLLLLAFLCLALLWVLYFSV